MTKLERTLIDLAVRPQYGGGVSQVLHAFRTARGRASSNVIAATLKKLEFTYPFFQAIGFYMERAGFPAAGLDLLRAAFPEMRFDFYLTGNMGPVDYEKSWRLYIPKGF